ncbi:MAG: hypothetical protein IJ704_05005 [Bacilli bacterium]|nr:hypothetical protein [Bacilli bacterium]
MELMSVDYQVVVNAIAVMMTYSAPIFIIFEIANKLLSLILQFIGGKKEINL